MSVVALGAILENRFWPRNARQGEPTNIVGTRLAVKGVDWRAADVNIVLFIRKDCHFCKASMPFYRRLARLRSEIRSTVSLTALTNDSAADLRTLLTEESVAVEGIYPPPANVGLAGTPTLLFVDKTGTIRRTFMGQLDSDREAQVIKLMKNGG